MHPRYFLTAVVVLLLVIADPFCAGGQTSGITYNTTRNGKVYEIRSGKIGIGIPAESSFSKNQDSVPAPIQYFISADGKITDQTTNYLQLLYPKRGGSGPLSMKITWLKKSKDTCRVQIAYTFNKYNFNFYNKSYPGSGAGPGYYKCIISVARDSKSVMITEDYDYELVYSVKVSGDVLPDQARWRGWNADALYRGYEKPGQVYRTEPERGYPMDATVDIDFRQAYNLPYMCYWSPLGGEENTGRYWMAYNSKAGEGSQLTGLFQGRCSQLIGASGYGVCFAVLPAAKNPDRKDELDVTVYMERRGPDNSWNPRKRFEWGLFLSTKRDLLPPEKTQPIFMEMNKQGGLGGRIDEYATRPARLNANFYEGSIFSAPERIRELIKRVKTDGEFYKYLRITDNEYTPLFDAWRSPDSARSLIKNLRAYYSVLRENYKTGEGIYREDIRYWKGANRFKFYAMTVSALFADKTITWKPEEKKQLESLVALMARIVWDNDNAPIFDGAGVNFGTANMPTMYLNSRYFFALLFSSDPEFKVRADNVLRDVRNNINISIYANGSSIATPHYSQAAIEPILFTMLQLKFAGVADLFRESPRIRKFANFYTNLLTPSSPRFSGYRKLVSFGDGSEEGAVMFALLASGYADIDTALSHQLYHAFQNGRPRMTLFGPVSLAADLSREYNNKTVPGTANYTGYMSTMRNAVNTPWESAVWILNGDSLFDHRNDDAGEMSVYALGAPLSVSRSCFYYPNATDGRIRSMVIPFKLFPEWDRKDQPIDQRSFHNSTWPVSTQAEFASFPGFQSSVSIMKSGNLDWRRQVVFINGRENNPVILILDSVTKPEPFVWSMTFMSEGAVVTPKGNVTPVTRIYNNGNLNQLPEGTTAMALPGGLKQFRFTGQKWNPAFHPTGGIDWDLYTWSANNQSFSLANWTNTWEVNEEMKDFRNANGRAYEESLQLLRIKGSGGMVNFILPFKKGQKPAESVKEIRPGVFKIPASGEIFLVSQLGYYRKNADTTWIGSWSDKDVDLEGYRVSGGPVEIISSGKQIILRIHGNSGRRVIGVPVQVSRLILPENIKPVSANEIRIDYHSSGLDLLSTEKGFTEYIIPIK